MPLGFCCPAAAGAPRTAYVSLPCNPAALLPLRNLPPKPSTAACLLAVLLQEFLAYDEPEFVGVWPRATSCPPAASA